MTTHSRARSCGKTCSMQTRFSMQIRSDSDNARARRKNKAGMKGGGCGVAHDTSIKNDISPKISNMLCVHTFTYMMDTYPPISMSSPAACRTWIYTTHDSLTHKEESNHPDGHESVGKQWNLKTRDWDDALKQNVDRGRQILAAVERDDLRAHRKSIRKRFRSYDKHGVGRRKIESGWLSSSRHGSRLRLPSVGPRRMSSGVLYNYG